MKKVIIFALVLVLAFALAGCGNAPKNAAAGTDQVTPGTQTEQEAGDSAADAPAKEAAAIDSYVFEINGVSIPMHAEAAPILDQLDGPKDYFESEACAFPGLEKVYQFDGFDLYTYEKDGVDYIASVVLFDDTVGTKEGLHLFDKKENVFNTYGEDYTNNLDLYTYLKGRSQLLVLIENDQVTSIEYLGTLD